MKEIKDECSPIVSVIMAILDPVPLFFCEAVRSVLNQTLTNWELVIVEDPSKCSAGELLVDFPDSRIRHFLNPERTSLAIQRNRALIEARADFVAILDADDLAMPFRLEKQLQFLNQHPEVGIVGSQIAVIDEKGQIIAHRVFPYDHGDIARAMLRVVPLSQPSVMFRRQLVLNEGGYFDYGYSAAEDYDLWSRLIQSGVRFANMPEILTHYRLHSNQLKAKALRSTIIAHLQVKKRYWCRGMDARSRLWMWGERFLLCLPQFVIHKLLVYILYRDQMPVSQDASLMNPE